MLDLQIIGNLGADATIKDFSGRKAVVFNVAHTDKWKDEEGTAHETTTWVSCIWNSDGGKVLPYLKKGQMVFVSGTPSLRIYDSPKEHCKVAGLNLRVNRIELVGGKREDTAQPAQSAGQGQASSEFGGKPEEAPF